MIIEFHGWFPVIFNESLLSRLKKGIGLFNNSLRSVVWSLLKDRKAEAERMIKGLLKDADYAQEIKINFCFDLAVDLNGRRQSPYLLVYYTNKNFGQIVDLVDRLKSLGMDVKKVQVE